METQKTDREAMWAVSGTGDDFQCIHIDEARDMEILLRECLKALSDLYDSEVCDPLDVEIIQRINDYLNT